MALKTIIDSIYSVVNPLVSTTKLTGVYKYQLKSSEAFPYAYLAPSDSAETMADTANNATTYQIVLRVFDFDQDNGVMEPRMLTLFDEVMAELRKDNHQTLAGTVLRFNPFSARWGWTDDQMPCRFFEINMSVLEEFDIYNP